LLPCLKQCAHCGIEFLTDPRNVGRTDLRCPFGCRLHHGRLCSIERSTAYYRTASGRRKKKRLNGRRSSRSATPTPDGPTVDPPVTSTPLTPVAAHDEDLDRECRLEGVVLRASSLSKSPMLSYARMLARLIDRVKWSPCEFLALLRAAVRQRSFAMRNRRDYVLAFLHQHPP
jgi:hypothetical protein